MTLRELKLLAKKKGILVRNMRRENIIRAIQRIEGNIDCFATPRALDCKQRECLWYNECLSYYNKLNPVKVQQDLVKFVIKE